MVVGLLLFWPVVAAANPLSFTCLDPPCSSPALTPAADPRNRKAELTREFLAAHLQRARLSLRDICYYHGHCATTVSRVARWEPVGGVCSSPLCMLGRFA